MKRLPGLSVANDQGEGRYVIIRGIDPNLVNVALNGQTLPAPEPDGRQVKLDDLPSALIQSITVTKSLLPSQDANAIGGEVNIRTKTAFDSAKPFFFDARGSVGWYALNNKVPFEIDGTAGGRFGAHHQFGAVVSVNYSKRPIESENFQATTAYTVRSGVSFPDQGGLRDYNLTRTRLGIVGNFDWRPNDAVKIYVRSSYSQFKDAETRDQDRLDAITFTNSPQPTGAFTARGSVLVRRRIEDDNTKSITLGGDFDLPVGKLSVSGGFTRAVKLDPIRSEFRFRTGNNAVSGTYDVSPRPFVFDPFVGADPSRYIFNSFNLETRQASEDLWQVRADYTVPLGLGDDSSIAVGGKYLDRRKRNNQDRTNYGTVSGSSGSASFQLPSVSFIADTSFYGSDFTFGPRIDYDAARAFLNSNPNVARVNATSSLADSLSSDYLVREKIVAGYIEARLRFGGLTIIPGVRVEHTEDDDRATVVDANSTLTDGFNSFGTKSYTDAFPGLNLRYEARRDLVLRGAVTTSIGRPNYADLAPFVLVEDGTPPAISLGNPGLNPYYAVNLDASAEYYPNKDSIVSVGLFWKHIDNPIYNFTERQTNVTFAGVLYASADVTQAVNADDQILRGVEVNVQTQFTGLPGILSGFGISGNYAHISGHANATAIRAGNIPLASQSGDVGNVQLFFEKYGLAARLAYNYRSAFLDTVGDSAATDQFTDANGQLDFHISYQIIPQVTIFGDATNLTDVPFRRYIGVPANLIERERYSYQLRGGVQIHF